MTPFLFYVDDYLSCDGLQGYPLHGAVAEEHRLWVSQKGIPEWKSRQSILPIGNLYPPKCQYRVITLATNLIHMTQNLPTYPKTVPPALSTRLATPISHAP